MEKLTIDKFINWFKIYYWPTWCDLKESSLVEKDLGITGDDGDEMFEAIEKEFQVSFFDERGESRLRELFNLQPDEYLFYGEGSGCLLFWWQKKEKVKPFTVRELYEVVVKLQEEERIKKQKAE